MLWYSIFKVKEYLKCWYAAKILYGNLLICVIASTTWPDSLCSLVLACLLKLVGEFMICFPSGSIYRLNNACFLTKHADLMSRSRNQVSTLEFSVFSCRLFFLFSLCFKEGLTLHLEPFLPILLVHLTLSQEISNKNYL